MRDRSSDFNPGPSAPRADGTREAEPNLVGPFYNLEGLITHIVVQGTAAILRNDAIDLSNDEDLADDALEQLIKSKEEAEIFNDLPLFDVTIIHNFIDEWFDTPNISFEDLQLPIGLSVAFQGAITSELAIA